MSTAPRHDDIDRAISRAAKSSKINLKTLGGHELPAALLSLIENFSIPRECTGKLLQASGEPRHYDTIERRLLTEKYGAFDVPAYIRRQQLVEDIFRMVRTGQYRFQYIIWLFEQLDTCIPCAEADFLENGLNIVKYLNDRSRLDTQRHEEVNHANLV